MVENLWYWKPHEPQGCQGLEQRLKTNFNPIRVISWPSDHEGIFAFLVYKIALIIGKSLNVPGKLLKQMTLFLCKVHGLLERSIMEKNRWHHYAYAEVSNTL